MAAFNATKTLSATLAALRSGETKLRELFALSREQAEQIALAATATAATPAGYADIRLLLARMSWHAGVAGKAGNAPSWILRSGTSKGVTTISVRDYVYNANKARGASTDPAASAAPSAPARTVTVATSGDADASTSEPSTPDHAAIIAGLQSELSALRAQLDAERTAHAATRAELDTARQMLAAIPQRTARKPAARKPASNAAAAA